MGLLFRAIWQDGTGDALGFGMLSFRDWVRGKTGIEVPDEGTAGVPDGTADVLVERAQIEQTTALRAALHEERQVDRWTTTLTVITDPGEEAWYWVDLEFVAQDAFRLPDVDSPRLVRQLLERGVRPHRGAVALSTTSAQSGARDVAALVRDIADIDRDIPFIVFTPDPEGGFDLARTRADSAAQRLGGAAAVSVLSPTSVRDFGDLIGPGLGVWGGACRVYLPGRLESDFPYRHFFLTSRTMGPRPETAGLILMRRLATSIAARRAPDAYAAVRTALARGRGRESLEALERSYLDALEDQERLRAEKDLEVGQRVDAVADAEEANERVADLQRQLDVYRRLVVEAGLSGAQWSAAMAATPEIPTRVGSCLEAAENARAYLPGVVLQATATAKTHELDEALESGSWGQTSWRALRALQAYTEDADEYNGFWDWCEHSGSAYAWPASPKKLAMSESEGVTNSPEMRAARTFAISTDVDASGVLMMEAHMKIATGGGPLSPRIYFHDDTKGRTGRIHVGFFGPHRHVPNPSKD